jgi:hypothetical protein
LIQRPTLSHNSNIYTKCLAFEPQGEQWKYLIRYRKVNDYTACTLFDHGDNVTFQVGGDFFARFCAFYVTSASPSIDAYDKSTSHLSARTKEQTINQVPPTSPPFQR